MIYHCKLPTQGTQGIGKPNGIIIIGSLQPGYHVQLEAWTLVTILKGFFLAQPRGDKTLRMKTQEK